MLKQALLHHSLCHRCHTAISLHGGRNFEQLMYCSSCFDARFFHCAICGKAERRDYAYIGPNDSCICSACFNLYFVACFNCGTAIPNSEAQTIDDETYCSDCVPRVSEWPEGEFAVQTPHFDIMASRRGYGVELETSTCDGFQELNGNTIWGCHKDPSIEGMEFISPILYGDEGFIEIKNFCAFAKKKGFRVNRLCGYHVHFDMRNETEESLKAIAYAYSLTYPMWCALVPGNRSNNAYCGGLDYSPDEILKEDWEYFVGKRDRFEYINWRAYLVHGSMEIRLYQGTLDATEICNWIKIHAMFIDSIKSLAFSDIATKFGGNIYKQFEALTVIIGNDLADYWAKKAHSHGKNIRMNLTIPESCDRLHINRGVWANFSIPPLPGEHFVSYSGE